MYYPKHSISEKAKKFNINVQKIFNQNPKNPPQGNKMKSNRMKAEYKLHS